MSSKPIIMGYLPTARTMVYAELANMPHDELRHEETIRLAFIEGVVSMLSCLSASSIGDHPEVDALVVEVGREVMAQRAISRKLRRL